MAKPLAVHFAGDLNWFSGKWHVIVAAGYAACCSGERAKKIRSRGNHTYDRAAVTCLRCLFALHHETPQ